MLYIHVHMFYIPIIYTAIYIRMRYRDAYMKNPNRACIRILTAIYVHLNFKTGEPDYKLYMDVLKAETCRLHNSGF